MVFGRSSDSTDASLEPERRQSQSGSGSDSVIARGMVLEGDCETDGALRIDGHVTGSVRAKRLAIGPDGEVDGDVHGVGRSDSGPEVHVEGRVGGAVRAHKVEIGPKARIGSGLEAHEATVRGHVKGAVSTAHRLLLEETAIVEGDVTARRLGLQEGGQVFGTIRIGERPED